jgi:amino acid transporter
MATYFIMGVVDVPLMFAMFFNDLLRLLHVPLSNTAALCVGVLVSTVPIAILCLRGAEASVKTTMRLMVAETLVVVALSLTILMVKWPEPDGISLSPFNPRHLSNGMSGFWAAMILGTLAFCGFDVVSTAAEEAHAPSKHVPKAILVTIIGMGLFWATNAWVFTLSTPVREVLDYTRLGLPAVMLVAQDYWGWGSLIIILTAFTATMAVYISIVQGASRIVFALARHGLMPSLFARLVGPRRVPRNAILGVLACAVLLDFATLLLLRNGIDSYNWWAGAIVFFATLTFMGVNLANALYFFRFARRDFSVLKNVLLPMVGFALNAYLLYAAFFSSLWSSDFRTGKSVVIVCVTLLAAEIAVVLWMRVFAPQVFVRGAPLGAV